MKTCFRRIFERYQWFFRWTSQFGINLVTLYSSLRGLRFYIKDYRKFRKQAAGTWSTSMSYPCLTDRSSQAGLASGHYFHQDLYVAKQIFKRNPVKHVDVGSRIDGFVAHVASYREIEILDVRPLDIRVANISFKQADFMSLDALPREYCDSLSCLHVIEHFGLGRYGDAIDMNGWKKGIVGLATLLKRNGTLYLSTPIGKERVEFNAHRIFAIPTIINFCKVQNLKLINLSYIDDQGDLHEGHKLSSNDLSCNLNLNCGCGIFEFQKVEGT